MKKCSLFICILFILTSTFTFVGCKPSNATVLYDYDGMLINISKYNAIGVATRDISVNAIGNNQVDDANFLIGRAIESGEFEEILIQSPDGKLIVQDFTILRSATFKQFTFINIALKENSVRFRDYSNYADTLVYDNRFEAQNALLIYVINNQTGKIYSLNDIFSSSGGGSYTVFLPEGNLEYAESDNAVYVSINEPSESGYTTYPRTANLYRISVNAENMLSIELVSNNKAFIFDFVDKYDNIFGIINGEKLQISKDGSIKNTDITAFRAMNGIAYVKEAERYYYCNQDGDFKPVTTDFEPNSIFLSHKYYIGTRNGSNYYFLNDNGYKTYACIVDQENPEVFTIECVVAWFQLGIPADVRADSRCFVVDKHCLKIYDLFDGSLMEINDKYYFDSVYIAISGEVRFTAVDRPNSLQFDTIEGIIDIHGNALIDNIIVPKFQVLHLSPIN